MVPFVMISIKNKEGGGGSNRSPVPPCLLLFLNYITDSGRTPVKFRAIG